MKKNYIVIAATCLFLLISGICYSCAYQGRSTSAVLVSTLSGEEVKSDTKNYEEQSDLDESLDVASAQIQTEEASNTQIYVHICGAVVKPGVYQVEAGSRLIDLIELSGGLNEDAAGDYMNQAGLVTDGQRIYIPTAKEVEELTPDEFALGIQSTIEETTGEPELVNINTANADELMELPGIGQAKAELIIDYRRATGQFKTIEELMNIPGIKEGLFNQISSYIIVK
jgi:competence protein ComEA